MCGIVGFVDKRKKKEKEKIIEKMADRIIHRGPDGAGYYVDDVVALGHRRLSIIDLSTGDQPIYNKDKSKMIIYNGELYNYKELKSELESLGYEFQTKTDTEVILLGYEEWGDKLYSKLRGMFAFVIYDKNTHELVGARDYFGIKPFYYYQNGDTFMFASEIKTFLEHPDFVKEVNTKSLKMFLIFQYNVKRETFFKGVFKLNPGEYFHYKDGKLDINTFYELKFNRANNKKSYEEIKSELKEVIENSVYAHQLNSDVEVGSYLSGGVDSSYVASVALPDKTFSVGFSYEGFDETNYAKELSDLLEINNKRKKISANDFFEAFKSVQYHTDEPDANLSTVPLYFLSELAARDVKVVLSGEGADEMFGGYNEYNDPKLLTIYTKLPLFLRKFNRNVCKHLPHFPGRNTIIKYGRRFSEYYIGHGSYMEEDEANRVLCPSLRSNEMIRDITEPLLQKVKNEDELTKKMYLDYHLWLPEDILLKADKMSMSHSLELRTPLMDIDVFKYASTIPSKYLVKDNKTKYIFRDIADDKVPSEWASRRKLGFPVPFSKWLKEQKYYKIVSDYFNKDYVSDFFDKEYINKLLDEHHADKANYGREIYNIFSFLVWYRVYFVEN